MPFIWREVSETWGTLRNIKVYRGGTLISTVDVYDFLRRGHLSGNVRLADNDVIVVGPYEMLAQVSGKVKRPMFYEMKRGESLGTLISYAGGFAGDAYTRSVRVRRKTGRQYSIFNVNEFDMRSSEWPMRTLSALTPSFQGMRTWSKSRVLCSVRVCTRLEDASIACVD